MTNEPAAATLIAGAAGMVLILRQVIEDTNRDDPHHVAVSLDAIHEHLALCGGSMLELAEQLGVADEVSTLIAEGRRRLSSLQASSGLAGRA